MAGFGCIAFLVALAYCVTGASGADVLKSIDEYREGLVSQAIEKSKGDGSQIDTQAIQKQVREKAEEAVKSVDPAKIDAKEGLDWAQVFDLAGRPREVASLLIAFIGSKPEAPKLFEAQEMLVGASWRIKDDKAIVATLQAIKGYDASSSVKCAELVITYAPHESELLGLDRTAALIDEALDLDTTGLDSGQKDRFATLQAYGVESKIEMYSDAGKTDKALAAIDDAMKTAPGPLKDRLTVERNRLTLGGLAAPALKVEKSYGEFKSVADLKGKVVVLDFFAHWCGPCKSEFADLRKLFDDLHGKGVEVVGVTRFYGFLGDQEKSLTADEEYAKMAGFVKDQQLDWPVVFGPEDNFGLYGVTAIPQVVLIGRDGIVRSVQVGFAESRFPEMRKKVEDLLAQKTP